MPGFRIDLGLADVACRCNRSAPAAGKSIARAKSRRHAVAAMRSPARRRWRGRSAPASCFISGTPLTRTAPSFSSRSSADASSSSAAALSALSRTTMRGLMHRVAGGHRLTAGEGAEAERGARGVAGDHVDLLRRHVEHVRRQLRQHRLGALALRAGAGGDDDPCPTRRCASWRSRTARGRSPRRSWRGRARDSGLASAPQPAAPGNPPSRRPRARGAGTPDSRRCRRSWSSRRAA